MSDTLVFLANQTQCEVWKASGVDALPVTGDFNLLARFTRDGVAHVDLWAYLDESAMQAHDAEAWDFCRRFAVALKDRVCVGAADLLALCRFDLFWSVRAVLNSGHAAAGALKERLPRKVVHFAEMATPDYYDLPSGPADLFNAAVALAARTAGVPTQSLSLGGQDHSAGLFRPAASRGEASAERKPWPACVDVLCVAEGLGVDEQMLLMERARHDAEQVWVSVMGDDAGSMLPSVPLRLLRWLPFDAGAIRTAATDAMAGVPALIRAGSLRAPPALAEPEFSFVWKCHAAWVERAATEYRLSSLLARAWRPKVMVMGSDIFGPGRCAAQGWMDAGTPVIAIDHVGLGWSSSHRWHEGTRTHLAVWGEPDAQGRRTQKQPDARIEAVGSLRADFARMMGTGPTDCATGHVAVFTSETSSGFRMTGWSPPAALRSAWDALLAAAAVAGVSLVVKPHPRYDHPDFYAHLIAARCPAARLVKGPAGEALAGASAAVLVNTPSTVLVQIIAAGVPAIYLRHGVAAFSDPPIPVDQVITVSTATELADVLRRLREDAAFRAATKATQRAYLAKVLAATGDKAAERMTGFVHAVGGTAPRASPDPAAKWALDVVTALNDFRRGALDRRAFRARIGQLAAESEARPLQGVEGLDPVGLADHYVRVATWADWTDVSAGDQLAALAKVRRLFPHRSRPALRKLVAPALAIIAQAAARNDAPLWVRCAASIAKGIR